MVVVIGEQRSVVEPNLFWVREWWHLSWLVPPTGFQVS
jgi:hypothetical protein